jgi:hypothetical protein
VPLEVRMPLCIGTSLAIIIPTSIARSAPIQARRGRYGILKLWWLPVVIGVVAGSRHRALRAGAAVQDRVRLRRLVGRRCGLFWRATTGTRRRLPTGPLMRVYGFFIGLLSTLMGVGGGLFANLLMTFYGRPDPSGGRHLLGAGRADLDPRRDRLRLCRLARRGALSRRHRAAGAVRARLCLADRRRAGDADHAAHAPLGVRAAHALSKRSWRSPSAAISSLSAAAL